jgi:hypothetical protein
MTKAKRIAAEKRIDSKIRQALKEVERIQSILHPVDHKDQRLSLYHAHNRKEDAIRGSVIHINLAMEALLDDLFRRFFLGYRPNSKKPRRPKGKRAKELDELLDGRLSFDTKLRLARIIGLISKRQAEKLAQLNKLRNKCAHNWNLDVAQRKRESQRANRLLEYNGQNLFKIDALESLFKESGPVYLSMFGKLLGP